MRAQLFWIAIVATLTLSACGGGGGGTPNQPPAQPPNVAGTWNFLETITSDPSGNLSPGDTVAIGAIVSQSGSAFTALFSTGDTAIGSLIGSSFTLTSSTQNTVFPGTVYAVTSFSSGTATNSTFTGSGYSDYLLVSGPDAGGLHGVRITYNFAGVRQS